MLGVCQHLVSCRRRLKRTLHALMCLVQSRNGSHMRLGDIATSKQGRKGRFKVQLTGWGCVTCFMPSCQVPVSNKHMLHQRTLPTHVRVALCHRVTGHTHHAHMTVATVA